MNEAEKGKLIEIIEKKPEAELGDVIKLLYQSRLGAGHMISDEMDSLDRILEEAMKIELGGEKDRFEELIGEDFVRMNLVALGDISPMELNKIFMRSCEIIPENGKENLKSDLEDVVTLCEEKKLRFDAEKAKEQISEYIKNGCPIMSHSENYKAEYSPAYRVVKREYMTFYMALAEVHLLSNKAGTINIAIDGNSGSGKSTLGEMLADIFDANLFHADDFFLPQELRTAERLAEIGGNMDYVRFKEEICENVKTGKPFSYKKFDCSVMDFGESVKVAPKKMNIFEGCYTMRPELGEDYNFKIFVETSRENQLKRIKERSGEQMLKRFTEEWIPMEDKYFEEMKIKEKADLTICT